MGWIQLYSIFLFNTNIKKELEIQIIDLDIKVKFTIRKKMDEKEEGKIIGGEEHIRGHIPMV